MLPCRVALRLDECGTLLNGSLPIPAKDLEATGPRTAAIAILITFPAGSKG
jgi:hypothetical protein